MNIGKRLPDMWTVYDHPTDFPSNFVARLFVDGKPTENVIVSPNLDALRAMLSYRGLVALARSPEDEAQIVETWL